MAGKIRRDWKLTQERLKEVLHYDPVTGIFTNLMTRGGELAGTAAGTIDAYGYVEISIDSQKFKAHRLAWFYATGKWPDPECDHHNRARHDNRLTNLREASPAQQRQNQAVRCDSRTGIKGVTYIAKKNRYGARIMVGGRSVWLGQGFLTAEEAGAAYAKAKARLHPFQPTVPVPA